MVALCGVPAHPDQGVTRIQGECGGENEENFHPLELEVAVELVKRKLPVCEIPSPGEKWLYKVGRLPIFRAPVAGAISPFQSSHAMKVLSSLASAKRRHADCQVVKRKGTVYVICKSNPKFKARQGATAGTRLSKKGL